MFCFVNYAVWHNVFDLSDAFTNKKICITTAKDKGLSRKHNTKILLLYHVKKPLLRKYR